MNKFDVMEVGSGSGLEVSSEAVERGLSVAVVDEGPDMPGSGLHSLKGADPFCRRHGDLQDGGVIWHPGQSGGCGLAVRHQARD